MLSTRRPQQTNKRTRTQTCFTDRLKSWITRSAYVINACCKLRFALKWYILFSFTSPATCLVMLRPTGSFCHADPHRYVQRAIADANLRTQTDVDTKMSRPHISGMNDYYAELLTVARMFGSEYSSSSNEKEGNEYNKQCDYQQCTDDSGHGAAWYAHRWLLLRIWTSTTHTLTSTC